MLKINELDSLIANVDRTKVQLRALTICEQPTQPGCATCGPRLQRNSNQNTQC